MLVTAAVWTVVVPYPFSDIAVPLALQHATVPLLLTYLLIRLYYPLLLTFTTGTASNTKMQDDGEGWRWLAGTR